MCCAISQPDRTFAQRVELPGLWPGSFFVVLLRMWAADVALQRAGDSVTIVNGLDRA